MAEASAIQHLFYDCESLNCNTVTERSEKPCFCGVLQNYKI